MWRSSGRRGTGVERGSAPGVTTSTAAPSRLRVMHVVNRCVAESIPVEVAAALSRLPEIDATLVVYYTEAAPRPTLPDALEVIHLGVARKWDVRSIRRLRRAVDEVRPDVVHVHHAISAVLTCMALVGSGIPVVKTEHQDHRRQPIHQTLMNVVSLARAKVVLCNSEATRRSFYAWERVLTSGQAEVVYNGVDVDRVQRQADRGVAMRERWGIPPHAPVVGTVGRFVEQKNGARLADAFAVVAEQIPGAHLVMVGEGPQRSSVTARLEELGLGGRVTLPGSLARDEVYATLFAMDVFVVPSLWEGFCNAAVEAAAAGRPIVAADITTLREVLGDVAWYADPRDVRDLADQILAVLDADSTVLVERGADATARASEQYSLGSTAAAYGRVYRSMVSPHG